MENPRTRIPGEWAPPPPIVVGPAPAQTLPPPRIRPEEEFEATLGSLVEHFNTLPPPAFGEAPELAAPAPRREAVARTRRPMLVVWVGSLALGATVAGGVMLGLNLAKPGTPRELAAPVVAPAPTPEVKIVVKSLPEEPTLPAATEKSGPAAEPIDDAPTAAVAEHSAAEETAKASANPDRKPRKVQIRKRVRPRRAGPSGPQVPASTSGDGWEDPYK